jgi:hypothetical protein
MPLQRRFLVLSCSFDPKFNNPPNVPTHAIIRAVYNDPAVAWSDIRAVYEDETKDHLFWVQEVLSAADPMPLKVVPLKSDVSRFQIVKPSEGGLPHLTLSEEQKRAFETVCALLNGVEEEDEGPLGIGSGMVLLALDEYRTQFIKGF